ncbi:glutamyl aminopeptidase-like isoform X2 [Montipora foliosa]|uniref:glutamyl aminopeptidase-like isoform X2 n=1 Tax=Montipora foliosa TaxID=591990 RepID=UPI0035F1F13B
MEGTSLKTYSFGIRDQSAEYRTAGPPLAATHGRFVPRGVIATVVTIIILLIILVVVLGTLLGKAGDRNLRLLQSQEEKEPTQYVLLHTNRLAITLVTAQTVWEDKLVIKEHFWFERNQFYVIHFDARLAEGEYVINMSFEAVLGSELGGLYRMQYMRSDGTVTHVAATQFSPADARKAFPCFDEPAMKATFNVTLVHHPSLIALSNMPIYQSQEKDGWKYDSFEKSVVMSTYLVAFAICDFKFFEFTHNNAFKVSIYAPQKQIDQVDYASKITDHLFTFYEEYFEIKYALPKADMIAIPNFLYGAMENWGLVTYKDWYLLYKPNISSSANKQKVAEVVSHELAHQWFGNLVTMEWWDDFWLNEGFASFMEFRSMDFIHPEWKMDDQVAVVDMFAAYAADSMETSHPIRIPINRPEDISQIFDSITYEKGACILRMLEDFLGKEVFRKGLSRYLKKFEYSNAKTENLWQALEEESCIQGRCLKVKHMMNTWTLQMGYPVIDVRHFSGDQYLVSQERFLNYMDANATSKFVSPFKYEWFVPFTYITSSATHLVISKEINTTSEIILWDGSGWIKGNAGQKGLYRVNYDDKNWEAFASALSIDHKVMNVSDRAGVIDDAFELARSGRLNYTKALELTSYLQRETEYVPWVAAVKNFKFIKSLLTPERPAFKHLQRYLLYLTKSIYERLGFTDRGSHLETMLRPVILETVCAAGEKSCLLNASKSFHKWMKDPLHNQIPANFRSLVYYYGIAGGSREEWEFAFNQLLRTSIASEKANLLHGLAASTEPWIISRYLHLSLDSTKIKTSDTPTVIFEVATASDTGRQIAWDFIIQHWGTLETRYGDGLYVLRGILEAITGGFTNEFQLKQLMNFARAHDNESGRSNQAVEVVKANVAWIKRNEKDLGTWLDNFLSKLG